MALWRNRRRVRRSAALAIVLATLLAAWGSATRTASSTDLVVSATIATMTTTDATSCTGAGALQFDALGADTFSALDTCRIGFGGTGPTELRLWQRDQKAPALEMGRTFTTLQGSAALQAADSVGAGQAWIGGEGGPGMAAGFLVHTTDGGTTWQQQTPCMNQRVLDIEAVSTTVAYLATYSRVCRTTDGGATWSTVFTPPSVIRRMEMLDAMTGWALTATGQVFHTINGVSWSLQYSEPHFTNLVGIDADASGRVVVAGTRNDSPTSDYGVIVSTDGGATWTRTIHTSTPGFDTFGTGGVLIVNATTWLAGHRYGIWRTTNSGATWAAVSPLALIADPRLLPNGSVVAPYGGATHLRRSNDAGATWSTITTNIPATNSVRDIAITDDNELWLAGEGDLRARTTDGGTTWQLLGTENPGLRAVVAWGADRWVVAGDLGFAERTDDGGSNLVDVPLGTTQHMRKGLGLAGGVGLLVGDAGTILRTTDHGATWSAVTSPSAASWSQVVNDGSRIWLAGNSGNIASSHDQGATWTLHAAVPGAPAIMSLAVADGVVWVGSSAGGAWKSPTSAVSWSALPTGTTAALAGAWAIDDQTAMFLVGYGLPAATAYIRRTTDGGATWTTRPLPATYAYALTPHGVDHQTRAWIASTTGGVIETIDGGMNWSSLPAISGMQNLTHVEPVDGNRLIAVGGNKTLARSQPITSIPDDIAASGSGFGACLASTAGTSSTNWPVTGAGNCTTSAPTAAWQPIAERPTDPGALVANTATNATVDLNFGLRVGSAQRAGAYRADLVFEAVAP
ncbi:MAG: hypothetical protein JWO69_780 [Thermoleophilia bacterium]|nr:hypothetical protein [Thermoleophilia bacterium]